MSWNHRVCKRTYNAGTDLEETYYEIHECYYESTEPPDGKPWGIGEACRSGRTADGSHEIPPMSEDVEGLRWLLTKMLEALDKPVIDYETRERV